ncbi:MAG: ArsA family ATPase, partial [Candidatus Abyssobacteria bacterium SURF_17]
PPQKFADAGLRVKGELHAMMLDTKRTFDELVIKHSLNDEMRQKILGNVLYQNLSNAFAGSQEYMAMEKLYEIYSRGKYDLIVLDTPPTKHALDFLEAPKRMTDFLDGSVLKWFLKPYFSAGKVGIRMFQRSTAVILGTLEKVTGVTALKVASDFFIAFEGMYDGFKERAKAVYEMLLDQATAFVLVTSPEDITIEEAMFFYDKLIEYDMPFCGLIVNKVYPDLASAAEVAGILDNEGSEDFARKIGSSLGRTADEKRAMEAVAARMVKNLQDFQMLAEIDAQNIRRLREHLDEEAPMRTVPFFETDIYDIGGLTQVNKYVFGDEEGRSARR